MKLTVIDSIMGSGKTTEAIKYINNAPHTERFIYITPYLSEVERVKKECNFYEPTGNEESKYKSAFKYICSGKNIVTTHALYKAFKEEFFERVAAYGNYTLIIDEVPNVVDVVGTISQDDINIMLDAGLIEIDDRNIVRWKDDKYRGKLFNSVKSMASSGTLYYKKGSSSPLLMEDPNHYNCFNKIFLLTYMFNGQIFKAYCDVNQIPYRIKTLKSAINKKELSQKIHICDNHKMNEIGKDKYALSHTWYNNHFNDHKKKLKNNIQNYIRHIVKCKGSEAVWTTFSEYKDELSGAGYTRSFLACNARATNDYKERTIACYLVNRFPNPMLQSILTNQMTTFDADIYALSEMLQWLFRTGIRSGKDIYLYVPSSRMRELLINWLEDDENEQVCNCI